MIFIPKVTYEQAAKEFADHGYTLLDRDVMVTKKMAYTCNKHPDKPPQYIDLTHLRRGQGCKYCRAEKPSPKIIKEDKLKELCLSRNFEYVKSKMEYCNENSKKPKTMIYFICNKHRDKGIQKVALGNIKKYKGCGYCSGFHRTTADFIKEINNDNIEVLGQYKNNRDKILCRCKIHDYTWEAIPASLLSGEGCYFCGLKKLAKAMTMSNDDFVAKLKEKSPYITPLDIYKHTHQKMRFQCNLCGTIWEEDSRSILQYKNRVCHECAIKRQIQGMRLSDEEFLSKLQKVNPNLEPLEEYVTRNTKIKVRCKIHDYVWGVTPANIMTKKTGCPKCKAFNNEKTLGEILSKWGYTYILQKTFPDCKDKNVLPFDIYLPDYNIVIEYDGEQHYQPVIRGSSRDMNGKKKLAYTHKHDLIKTEYCKTHGIPLIRIPYWEADNMESFLFDEMVQCGAIEEITAA